MVATTGVQEEAERYSAIEGPNASRTFRPSMSQRMTSEETKKVLREVKLRELKLDAMPIPEAIRHVNQLLQEQGTPERIPKILWISGDSNEVPRIGEMHLRDVPVGIALRYLCDATRCTGRVYEGTVIIEPFRFMEDEDYERFLTEVRIDQLDISDANVEEAVEMLASAVRKVDFDSKKPVLGIAANEEVRDAMINGQTASRVRGVNLRNVTVGEALREICRRSGTRYVFLEDEIQFWPSKPLENRSE